MKTRLLKKADIVIVLAVLAACVASLAFMHLKKDNLTAVITVDGEVLETINLSALSEEYRVVTPTVPKTVIVAENGKIRFESSECENRLCVKSGELSCAGAAAACLPAKVVVSVKSSNGIDAVTY